MTDIAILGAGGRMGHAVAHLAQQKESCRIVAGIDSSAGDGLDFPVFKDVQDMLAAGITPHVVVDFSHPDALRAALPVCAAAALPCVVCTTGLGEDIKQLMLEASAQTAVFYSANMSLGINLLALLAKQAQAMLQGFDIEIVEKHHRNKLDAPSGTALMLADEINMQAGGRYEYVYDRHDKRQKRGDNEIGISAVRGGSIVGEHDVLFAGPDEVVTLSHTAYSRDVFANGALAAAMFLHGKQAGMYDMNQLLGF